MQFKGVSLSREYYDAGYFIPDSVKRGDKFSDVRIGRRPQSMARLYIVLAETPAE